MKTYREEIQQAIDLLHCQVQRVTAPPWEAVIDFHQRNLTSYSLWSNTSRRYVFQEASSLSNTHYGQMMDPDTGSAVVTLGRAIINNSDPDLDSTDKHDECDPGDCPVIALVLLSRQIIRKAP